MTAGSDTGAAPLIKLCGLSTEETIHVANELRPEFVGFVFARASRREVSADRAASLRAHLAPGIGAVGVFRDDSVTRVAETAAVVGLDAIQLHGNEDEAIVWRVREATTLPVWRAFDVRQPGALEAARTSSADRLLLDSGGGTGAGFDVSVLEGFDRPFVLAGGLDPDNVSELIARAHPEGVDVSSGIETGGVKDPQKMRAFVHAVRGAGYP